RNLRPAYPVVGRTAPTGMVPTPAPGSQVGWCGDTTRPTPILKSLALPADPQQGGEHSRRHGGPRGASRSFIRASESAAIVAARGRRRKRTPGVLLTSAQPGAGTLLRAAPAAG